IAEVTALWRLSAIEQHLQPDFVLSIQSFFPRSLGDYLELTELFFEFLPLGSLCLLLEPRVALEKVVKVFRVSLVISGYLFVGDFRLGKLLPVSIVQCYVLLK